MSESKFTPDKDESTFPVNNENNTASSRPDISFGPSGMKPAMRPENKSSDMAPSAQPARPAAPVPERPAAPVPERPAAAKPKPPAADDWSSDNLKPRVPNKQPQQNPNTPGANKVQQLQQSIPSPQSQRAQQKPPQTQQTASAPKPQQSAQLKPPVQQQKKTSPQNPQARTPAGTANTARSGQPAKKPAAAGTGTKRPASGGQRPAGTAGGTKRPPQNGKRPASQTGTKKPAAKKPDTKGKTADTKAADNKKNSSEKKKKGKFTKKQALTIAGLIIVLILILLLIGYILLAYYWGFTHKVDEVTTSEQITYSDVDLSRADTLDKVAEDAKLKELSQKGTKISNKDVMNILLIGEDLRDTVGKETATESLSDDGEGKASCNTDVMMIISVNTKEKTITMTSIMRDCYVNFQDENGYWWSNRINSAYWYGGVDLTKSTIENYMNVKIDRYVLVNFNVFIDIVDALGGIEMDVTDDEANGYPDADPYGDNTRGMQNPLDEQNKYLHNKKGTDYLPSGGHYNLNGNQALAYSRIRHVGNSDYDRTMRQRKVITQMIKESRSMSLVDMDRLAKKVLPQIATDVTTTELAQLLVDMLDYRNYKIQEFRVPQDDTYYNEVIWGMDVLSVDFETNAKMFRELVYGDAEVEEEDKNSKPTIE